ncbi:MAG: wyosine [tRNA(Phe)-imidazoG37] synthetase (radical SAM superfamily) [Candidatus Krumholzibacteriia bacterium]|jgi:wyosine [tRNA(Phe)-imidazoG37] synthetase (radical SAM superfamily)
MRPKQANLTNLDRPLPAAQKRAKWHLPYAARPRYIQMETITKCNAKCPFCPQNEIIRDPARMPDEMWKKIVDDTRGWGMTYRPFLTNEPFVDNRQVEIVRYIKENDATAQVEFNTNAELLTEDLASELLAAGVDIMRFSIDGFSRETYEPSRVGISYEKVLERTLRFLELWDKGGYRGKMFTELRMIEVPENAHEIAAYKEFWAPKCSEVLITKMYQWPWTGQQAKDVVQKPCLKILDEMFFYTNGSATLCCWDVHERAVIGNVVDQSVNEIWEGHVANCLRATLDDGRRDLITLCSRCNAYQDYNFDRFKTGDT